MANIGKVNFDYHTNNPIYDMFPNPTYMHPGTAAHELCVDLPKEQLTQQLSLKCFQLKEALYYTKANKAYLKNLGLVYTDKRGKEQFPYMPDYNVEKAAAIAKIDVDFLLKVIELADPRGFGQLKNRAKNAKHFKEGENPKYEAKPEADTPPIPSC